MKVKTTHRVTHTLQVDDETEVELLFEPLEYTILTERVGDKLVVAYLVQDNDGSSANPMENSDCQGHIYLYRDRDSTLQDRSQVLSALCLNDVYSCIEPSLTHRFDFGGRRVTLEELAEEQVALPRDEEDRDRYDEEVHDLAIKLYAKHWREIVGPYVVPIAYNDYGSGGMRMFITSWDGDPDDLPDGVWVADAGAIENIQSGTALPKGVTLEWRMNEANVNRVIVKKDDQEIGNFGEWADALKLAQQFGPPENQESIAEAYAKGVVDEYTKWCNGEVYGCVVEVFIFDPRIEGWEKVADEDLDNSCWGYIGADYAKETLKTEFFDPAVKEVRGE